MTFWGTRKIQDWYISNITQSHTVLYAYTLAANRCLQCGQIYFATGTNIFGQKIGRERQISKHPCQYFIPVLFYFSFWINLFFYILQIYLQFVQICFAIDKLGKNRQMSKHPCQDFIPVPQAATFQLSQDPCPNLKKKIMKTSFQRGPSGCIYTGCFFVTGTPLKSMENQARWIYVDVDRPRYT